MASRYVRAESLLLEGMRGLNDSAILNYVLNELGNTFGAQAVMVFSPLAGAGSANCTQLGWGHFRDAFVDYASWVWKIDLWAPECAKRGPKLHAQGVLSQDLVPKSKLLNSAFYAQHLRPRGDLQHMMSAFVGPPNAQLAFALAREGDQRAFAATDLAELQKLKFHLEAFIRAYEGSHELEKQKRNQAALLDAQTTGMLMLDATGAILVANTPARDWLGYHPLNATGNLSHLHPVLWEACLDARRTPGSKFTVAARSTGSPEASSVTIEWRAEEPSATPTAHNGPNPLRAFLRITKPLEATLEARIDRFSHANGLSVMETAVLRLLVDGNPTQVATTLGLKISTVRSHMASIFMKTGKHRQPELLWALAIA
jgi:DNA-binding CsgD family transcriptional regulator